MKRRAMSVIVLSSVMCGCGTLMNVTNLPFDDKPILRAEKEVFGGVRKDAKAVSDCVRKRSELGPFWTSVGVSVWTADMTMSAIADTLTLPVTIPASIDRGIRRYYRIGEYDDQSRGDIDGPTATHER